MEPWLAWDHKDFVDCPVLIKTQGKTTTDHISPAGPWLRYRGHLDKFSDNMFMGAINAFTGEAGTGVNVLTGEKGVMVSKIARDYKAHGIKWVAIGDHNYGEGSQPRARRTVAATIGRLCGDCAQLCPHSRIESQKAGSAGSDLSETRRITTASAPTIG